MTTKEEYKARKSKDLQMLGSWRDNQLFVRIDEAQAFLSQTIDEIWALPEEKRLLDEFAYTGGEVSKKHISERSNYIKGYNACIAEAERMRDKHIKDKPDNPAGVP